MTTGAVRVPWCRPLSGRDPAEEHRASTPLELLFDLSFVVAVSVAAAELHHGLAEGRRCTRLTPAAGRPRSRWRSRSR